jgi:hypothetical protein
MENKYERLIWFGESGSSLLSDVIWAYQTMAFRIHFVMNSTLSPRPKEGRAHEKISWA